MRADCGAEAGPAESSVAQGTPRSAPECCEPLLDVPASAPGWLSFSATVSLVSLEHGGCSAGGFYKISYYFGFSVRPLFWGKKLSTLILFLVSQAKKKPQQVFLR